MRLDGEAAGRGNLAHALTAGALATLLLAACTAQPEQAGSPAPSGDSTAGSARAAAPAPAPKTAVEAVAAPAPQIIQWPLQSAFGSRLRFIGEHGVRFVEELAARTEGRIAL